VSHHHHHHGPTSYNRAFAVGVVLNLGFVAVEATYGYLAGSLALVADAGHNLSDVLGLLLAWGASWLATRRPTARYTYGWRRASILAALVNAVILLVALGGITWEALRRFGDPQPVDSLTLIAVAAVGIVINLGTALLFLSGHHDLNIRGAFLHMVADAGVSLGVVLAGVLTLFTGWAWLDPAISLVIAAIIFVGTWRLLRESLDLALDAAPAAVDPAAVAEHLRAMPAISSVHDLHVWALSTTETALTAHVVVADETPNDALLRAVCDDLHDRFGIEHATIQVERATCAGACCFGASEIPARPSLGAEG
jgi:cobalt-zinc-cadmium efflux system protein